jgi:hypothetical protein
MESSEFQRLVRRFRELGADDAESWARSEASENFPQLARFAFLRALWPNHIDRWTEFGWIDGFIAAARREPSGAFADAGLALARLIDAGASRDDLGRVARAIAYETVFADLERIDSGGDIDLPRDFPGWRLIETDAADELTGRHVGGLHESLLTLDPSGREGRSA